MKIALTIASLGSGGAERVMSLLANHWAERGDDVTLITLQTTAADAYVLDPRVARVALGLVEDSTGLAGALSNNRRRLSALRSAIKRSGAQAVVSFEECTNVLAILATRGLGVRLVVSERTDPTVHNVGRVWNALRRLTYPLADALVVQTARLLPWARRAMLRSAAAHAIPNPLRQLKRVREPRQGGSGRIVVALGRLWPEKGHAVLIRAFAALAPEFQEWRLVIVGDGPEHGALRALADSLGVLDRVALTGWMDTPEEALATSDVFVMSSRYEGFSNALLEAMGVGLPVVSTACGGSEEMIEHGVNGYVVAIDDAAGLAGAMRILMADAQLRERIGAAAAAASRRYTMQTIIPMWDALLSESCTVNPAPKSCSSSVR
jgi:GalNAc-alpha-(1->4)-GalNAc-alpha-(1->3)-diNAcBac-PP-undecaprenol alpha-1,4-N-acetyl-D-galactosaminyltransferase